MRNRELWSGGKICFPAPEEQAHRNLEGFSRKQPDMNHRTTQGEAAAPLHRTTQLGSLFFSNVTRQTKLNKPLVEKVHIGYRVAGKAVLKPSLSESSHHAEPHIQSATHPLKLLEHVLTISHCTPSAAQWESEHQSGALGKQGWWPSSRVLHPSSDPQNHRTLLRWTPSSAGSRPACFSLSCSKAGVLRKGRGSRTWGEISHDNYCYHLKVIRQWLLQKGDDMGFQKSDCLPKFNSGYILGRKGRIRVEAAMPHELLPYGEPRKMTCERRDVNCQDQRGS